VWARIAEASLATKYSLSPSPIRRGLPFRAGDDLVLVLARHDCDAVGAFDLPERFDYRVLEVSVECFLDR
jgi:hypothetical protein